MGAKKKGREKKSHILSLQGAYGPRSEAGWGWAQGGTNAEAEILSGLDRQAVHLLGKRVHCKHGVRVDRIWDLPSPGHEMLGKHLQRRGSNRDSPERRRGVLYRCLQTSTFQRRPLEFTSALRLRKKRDEMLALMQTPN